MKNIKIILCFLAIVSCTKEPITVTTKDYHLLVDKLTEVMIHDIFSPPVASRIYAYPNIAAYQVLNNTNGNYASLSGKLNGLNISETILINEKTNKELAALIAYLDVAKELVFSKEKITTFRDSLYNNWEAKNNTEFNLAKKEALKVSSNIISWMNKDQYKETRNYARVYSV